MTTETANDPSNKVESSIFKPLRIWPAVIMIVVGVLLRMSPGLIEDGPPQIWMAAAFGPLLCGLLTLFWWVLASRATVMERLVGFVGILLIFTVLFAFIHPTMRGPAVMILAIPMGMAGFALGAIIFRNAMSFKRTIVALLLATCGFGYSNLLRSDGMWGDFKLGLDWRWNESPEEKLLAATAQQDQAAVTDDTSASAIDAALANPEWPAFRGADRNGRQFGLEFESDWTANPPEELWKIAVGPGWSSFVVAGNFLFTQEQRGPQEAVVCYDAATGSQIWIQLIEGRFDDPLGGPGPRATPTLADGGLFVMGAMGAIMRLDPKSGDIVWQKQMKELAGRDKPPMWGYSSSPLVIDSALIVHAGGKGDKGVLALDVESGELKWSAAASEMSYSSPHPATVAGEQFVLMLTDSGVDVLEPESGDIRFAYEWNHEGYRALQPYVMNGDSIVLPTGVGAGTRRIQIESQDGILSAKELWTTRKLKPDFNDFVVFEGHAYGFDDSVFTCVDLETGKTKWKGGRYGKGQALLLEDSGLILIASEKGEIVLLDAVTTKHTELAKIPTLEGRTWNHPVVVGDKLYLRNSQEAAAFKLPVKKTVSQEAPKPDQANAVGEDGSQLR